MISATKAMACRAHKFPKKRSESGRARSDDYEQGQGKRAKGRERERAALAGLKPNMNADIFGFGARRRMNGINNKPDACHKTQNHTRHTHTHTLAYWHTHSHTHTAPLYAQ